MTTLETAELLASLGISAIPTKTDKRPVIDWKPYQSKLPTQRELQQWFKGGHSIALLTGKVQCLDFDEKYSRGIFERFKARAIDAELDGLIRDLIVQRTPSGGFHLVFQCTSITNPGNMKLAQKEKDLETHKQDVMIETRGDGGYFLISPSQGYSLEQGDWSSIPTISETERDALFDLARSFDERQPLEVLPETPVHSSPTDGSKTPGDDYDSRADVPALLRSNGWRQVGSGKYWTRPGKAAGISASWDRIPGRFFVFSSSTCFEPMRSYRPWAVYAHLECGGDFHKAAQELKRQGFGSAPKKKDPKPTPTDYASAIPPDPFEGIDPKGEAPTVETEEDKIRRMLRARSFDPLAEPPPMRVIYELGGVPICTPGNLTAITAQAKVGKSALIGAMMAAPMGGDEELDMLGVKSSNPKGKGIVFFDTEQSPDDFWHQVNRARRRAKCEVIPEWIHAHTVADLPCGIARKALQIAMADAAELNGGLHAVIIDGIADLVVDVNSAEECNGIVAELHALAIRYDCPIITVIHKNPGTEKVRGHLGSQLERKAETNLSLDKEDGVTVVWSQKQRRDPINKDNGPRFTWDQFLKMHVSVQAQDAQADMPKRVIELLELAEQVIKAGEAIRYAEFITRLQECKRRPSGVPAERTCERWIKEMKAAGIIDIKDGSYFIKIKPLF